MQVPDLKTLLIREALSPVSVIKAVDLLLCGVESGPNFLLVVSG